MKKPVWGLAAVVLAAVPALAAEPIAIRLKNEADAGKSVRVREVEQGTGTMRVLDPDTGQVVLEKTRTIGREEVYTETVLQKTGRAAERFQRVYAKAVTTADGQARPRSYSGRTLVFELKNNRYTVRAEGADPVDEMDLRYLAERADERLDDVAQALLPAGPVQEGDTWQLDGSAIARAYGKKGSFDPAHSAARVRLTKVALRDGRPCGTLDVGVRLALRSTAELKFETPPVLDIRLSLDTALDGSSTAGTMIFSGKAVSRSTAVEKGKKRVLETVQEFTGREEHSAEQ